MTDPEPSASPWPAVADLIPHAGDAILIDRVIAHEGDTTRVSLVTGSRASLRRADGSVPAWLAIEYMAQAIAVHEGLLAWADGRSLPLGFLISATAIDFRIADFEAGTTLRVDSRRVRGGPRMGVLSHECAIFPAAGEVDADPIVAGRLSIALDPSSNWGE